LAKKYQGQCACGAVKFEFDTDPTFIADCYCKDCQKSSGGVMATFFGVPTDDFILLSKKPKSALHRGIREGAGSRLLSGLRRAGL